MRKFFYFIIILLLISNTFSQTLKINKIDIEDGLSQSTINTIIQDKYGFIWIGTQDGLNRYDGYDFTILKNDPDDSISLCNNYITNLLLDDEELIVGTEGGMSIVSLKTHQSVAVPIFKNKNIESITQYDEEHLLVSVSGKGVYKYNKASRTKSLLYRNKEIKVNSIVVLKENLLLGTNKGVFFSEKKNIDFKKVITDNINVRKLIKKNDFSSYVCMSGGVYEIVFSEKPYSYDLVVPTKFEVTNLKIDTNGFWLISNTSLYKYDYKLGLKNFSSYQKSFFNINLRAIYVDRFGIVWIGGDKGVQFMDPSKQFFTNVELPIQDEGYSDHFIWSIYENKKADKIYYGANAGIYVSENDVTTYYSFTKKNSFPRNIRGLAILENKGEVLVGTQAGLYSFNQFSDNHFSKTLLPKTILGEDVSNYAYYCYLKDGDRIYFGTSRGLVIFNTRTNLLELVQNDESDENSLSQNDVRVIFKDSKDNIWVGTEGGLNLLYISQSGQYKFKRYLKDNTVNSLSNNLVTSIAELYSGELLISTYGGGINKFVSDSSLFKRYTEKNGLSNNVVYAILKEDSNDVWLSTNMGISQFNYINENFKNYFQNDGLQSNEFNIGAYLKSSKNEFYFGGINGVSKFTPKDIRKNGVEPLIVINNVLVNQKEVQVHDTLKFNYTKNNFIINFASLHFSNSEKNRYKYFLKGFEDSTGYITTNRQAVYTNLAPGEYTFKVYGSSSDDLWSETPAVVHLIITPPFWGTWWFRLIIGLFVIFITIGLNRIKLYNERKQNEKLEKIIKQRTDVVMNQKDQIEVQKVLIEKEKENVERILTKIFPNGVIKELKETGKAKAKNYENVTILFTDFVDFTRRAANLRPERLVEKLNQYFIEFDKVIVRNKLIQIKTIGDSYMCVGGLPKPNKTNPIDSVLSAIQINEAVNKMNSEIDSELESWEVRIGVHSGEVVSGILDTKRLAFDVWGNAVNIASRMQSSSVPGKVNISATTYKLVHPFFECIHRGKIATKNTGLIDMYFVNRIKPGLSKDEEGVFPNDFFWKYLKEFKESNIDFLGLEKYVIQLMKDELPEGLYYHSVFHTEDVVRSVERIGLKEGLIGDNVTIAKAAALLHDIGYIKRYSNNEEIGADYAREILPEFGFSEFHVEQVVRQILATNINEQPTGLMEKVMRDADLDYLGREDFHHISELLKNELVEQGIISSSRQWDEIQVKFFNNHKFYTETSINLRSKAKQKHLQEILLRLEENKY